MSDAEHQELFGAYLSQARARREASKDASLYVYHATFTDWLRCAVRPPALFLAFVAACVLALVILAFTVR